MEQIAAREFLYRYVDVCHCADLNEYDEPIANTRAVRLYCHAFEIIRRTPSGAWIRLGYDFKKFVNLNAHKRFACPTKEEAWESFRARKKRQLEIVSAQVVRARLALKLDPTRVQEVRIAGRLTFE
jgi:hypothetical protein